MFLQPDPLFAGPGAAAATKREKIFQKKKKNFPQQQPELDPLKLGQPEPETEKKGWFGLATLLTG